MKISITEDGKKVGADYAVVYEDTMYDSTGEGTSKVGQVVSVQGFVPKGSKLIILVSGKSPMECHVNTDSYLCIAEEPRMMEMNEKTGKKRFMKADEVVIVYAEDPQNIDSYVLGNDIFAIKELTFTAPRTIQ